MRTTLKIVLVVGLLFTPLQVLAEESESDPFGLLQQIRELFLEGNYEAVERTAERLLETGPSMLVRTECLQYLGASLELMGRSEEAEERFEVLLTLQPEFHMNQADFPTEVISLFESVRLRVQDRIDQIDERRRRQQDRERRRRERAMIEQQQRLLELARPRYFERDAEGHHLVVAFLPFGAGQFQNGHTRRGYAFLGTELGLMAGSMVLWLLGTLVPDDFEDSERGRDLYQGYQISSYAVYGLLVTSVVWGIVDAIVNYRRLSRTRSSWREVEESEIPEDERIDVDPELRELEDAIRALPWQGGAGSEASQSSE